MNFFDQFKKEHIIIAHRGYRSIRAENTMEAFRAALGKSDMFEFDVQFTKDFKPVVVHDDSLVRTTNVKEIFKHRSSYNVRDFDLKEIEKLDSSSWFEKADPYKTIKNHKVSIAVLNAINDKSVATLDEVLTFIKENNFPANLEIKDSTFWDNDAIAKTIAAKVVEYDIINLCIVSSFNHNYLKYIKTNYPQIKIAALFEKKDPNDIQNYLTNLKADAYHIDKTLAVEEKINKLKNIGIYTNVYTINSKDEEKKLFDMGIKGIFTDILEGDA